MDISKYKDDMTETKIITCRRISPPVALPLTLCTECEYNKGVIEEAPAQNGRPPVENVKCGFPVLVRVGYFLSSGG